MNDSVKKKLDEIERNNQETIEKLKKEGKLSVEQINNLEECFKLLRKAFL